MIAEQPNARFASRESSQISISHHSHLYRPNIYIYIYIYISTIYIKHHWYIYIYIYHIYICLCACGHCAFNVNMRHSKILKRQQKILQYCSIYEKGCRVSLVFFSFAPFAPLFSLDPLFQIISLSSLSMCLCTICVYWWVLPTTLVFTINFLIMSTCLV